jgi:hypothetical protein
MKHWIGWALIGTALAVTGCTGNPETERASAWECTAVSENDLGADDLYSWHDVSKEVAAENAMTDCKLHSANKEMCHVVLDECQPY